MSKSPAHGRHRPSRNRRLLIAATVVVVVVCAVAVAGIALNGHDHPSTASASATPKVLPLQVLSTAPAAGAANVAASAVVTVDLSTPLSATSPMPALSPAVPGRWSAMSPTELQFVADGPFVPGTQETLTVPGGPAGLLGAKGQRLAASVTTSFSFAPGSTMRLQQLLAELGYLPLSFSPATPPTSPRQTADVQQGTFTWRWALPASLTSQWAPGADNVITRGAVMSFESEHNLTTDGVAGPQVWTDLLQAAAAGATDPQPYGYVHVNQNQPETATVYQNGAVAYTTAVNTGVPGATTVDGTFPVYLRYRVTTMTGTNPDGSHYSDPGIPWVSYFNGGDALHGFVRSSYGTPQSDGCVEMPPANAAVVWPLTPIGTLVTVDGPPGQ